MLYTGTSFQVLDRVYYVETFSDITRDYENRDAQLRMFRMIMIIVMIVCLMLMAILNNMIVVPIRRLSKATKADVRESGSEKEAKMRSVCWQRISTGCPRV